MDSFQSLLLIENKWSALYHFIVQGQVQDSSEYIGNEFEVHMHEGKTLC